MLFIDCPEVLDLRLRGFGTRTIIFVRCYLHHLDIESIRFSESYPKENEAEKIDFKEGEQDDEVGFRLGAESFTIGEYVAINAPSKNHTYRVARVDKP